MRSAAAAIVLFLLASSAGAGQETVATIATRPGVSISFIVTAPDGRPAAIALLFSGGSGNLKLWRHARRLSDNFLVRSRALFAAGGVLALTLDAPSDRRTDGLANFRDGPEHRADVGAVIRWARARSPAPLWLVGTSRGTVSVAHLAAAGIGIDGAVFLSSVTEPDRRGKPTALDADLGRIAVPVLLAHHREDACPVTPVEGVERLRAALRRATRVETLLFSGGREAETRRCRPRSAHGFFGIEQEVVGAIVRRMVEITPSAPARR